jgi:hypothetical protein
MGDEESSSLSSTEINPFDDLGSLDEDDGTHNNDSKMTAITPQIRRERNWGLPSFQDQMDRGIRTYRLRPVDDEGHPKRSSSNDDNNEGVLLHLEHRLHSTGSDVWDAALVLVHALHYNSNSKSHGRKSFALPSIAGKRVLELGSGTVSLFQPTVSVSHGSS